MRLDNIHGATPLPYEAVADLKPGLSTQAELNEFEAVNIQKAREWATGSRILRRDYPSVSALLRLHREMFDRTWKWAGKLRSIDTTIGIARHRISMELYKLCDDTRFWMAHATYGWDELGVRFHHQLVAIHPFNNGNGRHARLAADILLEQHGQEPFTWGSQSLIAVGVTRTAYIAALQAADAGDYGPLLKFVRS